MTRSANSNQFGILPLPFPYDYIYRIGSEVRLSTKIL
jgi:hypothetical protein